MDKQYLINCLKQFECTNPVQKVINLQKFTKLIVEKYNCDIPLNFDELIQLPGVGKFTASLVYNYTFNLANSITVDTHVHKLANRLGFVSSNTFDETRIQLERWFPLELWKDV